MRALPDPGSLVRPLLADGAMGTALFAAGMPIGEAPEAWLLTEQGAAAVADVHATHAAAGAQLVLTCTFGANPLRMAGAPHAADGPAISRAAVAIARAAAPEAIVAASLGPTGGLLIPYGNLDPGAVRDAYAEEAAWLADAGADILWVETMMDLGEALAAVEGAHAAAPQLPVVATLVFTRGRTMFGQRPEEAVASLAERGVAGVGANCGDGFGPVEEVIATIAAAAQGLHVIAKANAGIPVADAQRATVYPGTPEEAATYARRVADAGATIVGGCCGTTAAHLEAMRTALA